MRLAELVAAAFFGRAAPPPALQLGLASSGVELVDGGYRRATVVKGDWQLAGPQAAADVGFGPFEEAVRFDEVLLLASGEVLERMALEGEVALLPGMSFEHRVTVGVSDG